MTSGRAAVRTRGGRLIAALAVVLVAAGATLAFAQQIWVGGGFGRGGRMSPRWAKLADFNGTFLYCRGYYEQARYEDGGMGWWTDYPNADHNFSVRLAELTRVYVKDWNTQPNFVVVALDDPMLYKCPMLFMEDVGTAELSEIEVKNLREFFLKGGFLWADDFWGSLAWNNWARQMSRVLPSSEYPIFDLPLSHPIMHTLYDVKDFPQIPSINFWGNRSYHQTSERGRDSAEVHFRGVQDSQGRLMALMTHNTDIADSWEREGESQEYFDLFSPRGYAIGVNVVLYAMTH